MVGIFGKHSSLLRLQHASREDINKLHLPNEMGDEAGQDCQLSVRIGRDDFPCTGLIFHVAVFLFFDSLFFFLGIYFFLCQYLPCESIC